MAQKKIDELTGVEDTGHVYDGITELNNPLPQWWLTIFYACVVWALAYTIFYPAWPLITENTRGVLGFSDRAEVAETIAAHAEGQAVWRDRIAETELADIRSDPDLLAFALASGAANFALNCSQCHGAGAAGNTGGFPNLNDDDWIWGGDLDAIYTTISHGIRNEADEDARLSMMPAFGAEELLEPAEIKDVAQHVLSLSGRAEDAAAAERGAAVFEGNCAACHGEEGLGVQELGAPNLADAIWLYGDQAENIVAQVHNPRHGVMPPWLDRLGETAVKELAIYVHSLGGGQ